MSADYIKKIRTESGDKQIDYTALANLPDIYTKNETEQLINDVNESIKKVESSISNTNTEVDVVKTSINELQNSKETILTGTASGTEVVATGGADAPLGDFSLYGKGEQVETTGEQLLPYPYNNTTKTMEGVTFQDIGDGGIALSGTPTGYAEFLLYNGVNIFEGKTLFGIIGTYSNVELVFSLYDENDSRLVYMSTLLKNNVVVDFNDYPTGSKIVISLKRSENDIAVLGTIYPVIVSGEIMPTEYEPYTGGIPSPNPDYPQEIKNVGKYNETTGKYEVEVTVRSAQLIDANRLNSKTTNGITYTNNNDGSITTSGTEIINDSSLVYDYTHEETVKLLKAGAIHLEGTILYPYFYIQIKTDSSVLMEMELKDTNKTSNVVTQDMLDNPESILSIGIYGSSQGTVKTGTIRPMLYQEGDGTFEPFKMHTVTLEFDQPLRGTKDGTVRDSRSFDGDVRRIKEVVFDGSDDERWIIFDNIEGGVRQFYIDQTEHLHSSTTPMVMSDGFRAIVISNRANNFETIYTASDAICVNSLKCETVSEWKAMLSENPITVQYVLKTPITETLPASEIAKLRRLQTFNPTTIITADGGEMEILYSKENDVWKAIAQNYVPKYMYDALEARILTLEQNVLS